MGGGSMQAVSSLRRGQHEPPAGAAGRGMSPMHKPHAGMAGCEGLSAATEGQRCWKGGGTHKGRWHLA